MEKKYYGTTKDGKEISIYTVRNYAGMEASFVDFGAAWVSMIVPDKNGRPLEMVLGYDGIEGYEDNGDMFGAFVGRVANRTEKGRFTLDGVEYQMETNDGENNLHTSNKNGFHKQFWNAQSNADNSVTFSYRSPDMENGLPGNMDVSVTYTLTEEGAVEIAAEAISDKRTIINLTQHQYFNIKGAGNGDIMDTLLKINADEFTPIRAGGIPTGEITSLAGTALDFRELKPIGQDFFAGEEQQVLVGGGYDHCFVVRGENRALREAAVAYNPESGITMTTYLDQPGVQLYTGNFIGVEIGKGGAKYGKYSGFALETHGFTNAINTPGFPSPVMEANVPYKTCVTYQFKVDKQ